jgi:type 1 glutamine amidotransferase
MKRFIKISLWVLLGFIVILGGAMSLFVYKIKNGFPVSYETEHPNIDFPKGKTAVLLFSKSTGFRHSESIDAGKKVFAELAKKNGWFLYSTKDGGVFNQAQLTNFDVVVFNNSTGRVLNDQQQKALEEYVTIGGSLVGIHGTGDNSHHWPWYVANFIGAEFSHHAIGTELQNAEITRGDVPDSTLVAGLPDKWTHADEWYVFLENPRSKGFHVIYSIDGEKINPDGNILWVKDKNFGMGKDHPVAWYRELGRGRTFYTSLGHDGNAWKQQPFLQMIENAVNVNP